MYQVFAVVSYFVEREFLLFFTAPLHSCSASDSHSRSYSCSCNNRLSYFSSQSHSSYCTKILAVWCFFVDLEIPLMIIAPFQFLFQIRFPLPVSFLFLLQLPPSLTIPIPIPATVPSFGSCVIFHRPINPAIVQSFARGAGVVVVGLLGSGCWCCRWCWCWWW